MTPTRGAIAFAALAMAVALAACSSEDAQTPDDPPAAEEAGTVDAGPSSTGDPGEPASEAASGAGVRDLDGAEVLVEQTYTMPGSEADEVTVGVLPLEVEGDVMTLRLAFTPNFASVDDDELITVYDMYPDNLWKFRPVLVDRVNLKEYSLISETGQDWSASTTSLKAGNGDAAYWWGVYAAPEDDIDTFDLRLRDSLPEFTAIPVP